MRIYMQMPRFDSHAPRFYHLHLQQDLLEGWSIVREWGFQGSGGRIQRDHFPDRDQAQQAMLVIRDEQIRRGYQVVFLQGMESR